MPCSPFALPPRPPFRRARAAASDRRARQAEAEPAPGRWNGQAGQEQGVDTQQDLAGESGTFRTSDGVDLSFRAWRGQGSQAVVYLHGIESHGEWMAHVAAALAGQGVTVLAPDRRGSGRSAGERGDAPCVTRLVQDVMEFTHHEAAAAEEVHLAALSWGGKLAVATALAFPEAFRSLMLVAPGLVSRLAPPSEVRRVRDGTSPDSPRFRFAIPIEDDMFTSRTAWLEWVARDPLRLRQVTARFLSVSDALDLVIAERVGELDIPFLLLLAEKDRIVDNKAVKALLTRAPAPSTVTTYEQCRHSLQFEDPDRLVRDLLEWTQGGWRRATGVARLP